MPAKDIIEFVAYLVIIIPLAMLLGKYIAKLFSPCVNAKSKSCKILSSLEMLIHKISGIDKNKEQSWTEYLGSLLVFNLMGFLVFVLILLFQDKLPLNPMHFKGVNFVLALNIAMSFVTNTNWQSYIPETTISYFSQISGIVVQNFLSAATGLAVLVALARGLTSAGTGRLGNFYADLVKAVLYILLPLSFIVAIALVAQGVPQNFSEYLNIESINKLLPQGPVASEVAIKQLGGNGGGVFAANSAHPFENPTIISNLIEMLSIILLPMALVFTFGSLLKDKRQGYTIFATMLLLFVAGLFIALHSEYGANHLLQAYSLPYENATNMEGKETRFSVGSSVFWSVATTATSNGSVNSMHDSFMPLSGLIQLFNIMLGEVVFGGVGSGIYGMLIFIIFSVFIAGLMVGRTPEYLGKKIEAREITLCIIGMLIAPIGILVFSAISVMVKPGIAGIQEVGPHGLTELLYAFASTTNNNGSAFAGFSANTNYYNLLTFITMLFGRFLFIGIILGIAGSLSRKNIVPTSNGTFPTHGLQFALLLAGMVLIIGGLTFLPVLVLGPVLEHITMLSSYAF